MFEQHKIDLKKEYNLKFDEINNQLKESQDRESRSVEALRNLNNLFTDMKADSVSIRTQVFI